jgi:aspartyl/asparaginyl beta-hydroxylase (cupin superfamily)
VVPPGCAFHVGGERREWHEGELLVFDDTVEHEAANGGTSDRIILMFDVWRPELSADERRAVTALFDAVDSYSR